MAKTDWSMNDTVMPADLNQIGQEINQSAKLFLSATPPANPTIHTWWYEDLGETPDLGGGGGLLVGNASMNDDDDVWFSELT